MTSRTVCAAIALLSALQSCARRQYYKPNWEDQTALHDVDAASLVVLGRVYATRTQPPARTVAGLRPAYADINVLRVLKGSLAVNRICAVYLLPSGGYAGPALRIPVPGTFGVFTLFDGHPCYRAVSDRQVFIPATAWPPDNLKGSDIHEVVGAITLPELDRRCTRSRIQEIADDFLQITSPLVGMRRGLNMMREQALDEGTTAEQCQCVVAGIVSLTVPSCMNTTVIPRPPFLAAMMERVRREHSSLVNEDRMHFLRDPLHWLRFTIENRGFERAVLALGSVQNRPDSEISAKTCQRIGDWLNNGEPDRVVASARKDENASAEMSARTDLCSWVEAGCAAKFAAQHFSENQMH